MTDHPHTERPPLERACPTRAANSGARYIRTSPVQAETLRSMLFSDEGPGPFCPFALEYIWEISDDRLTIWHGFKDSPAKFAGTIDRTARTIRGSWEWPGGGYEAVTTRID